MTRRSRKKVTDRWFDFRATQHFIRSTYVLHITESRSGGATTDCDWDPDNRSDEAAAMSTDYPQMLQPELPT